MRIIRDLSQLPDQARRGAVAIGNFDGVHRGHARIVERLLERAAECDGPAIVFTFDPHPVRILRPEECPPPLTWTERKADLLARHGVDWIIAYPTDAALLSLSAEAFFRRIVCDTLAARALVEGPNFYFGQNREGDVARLAELTTQAGLTLDVVEPVQVAGQLVSSSRIRGLLIDGDVSSAGQMLTDPYRVRGMVTHGAGRGAGLGFPTANLDAVDTLLPAHGVYAGRGWLGARSWPAAINLGPNPTFGEMLTKLEVHLVGCGETLYGQPLEVDFRERLRDIRPFGTSDELATQLTHDLAAVQRIVACE